MNKTQILAELQEINDEMSNVKQDVFQLKNRTIENIVISYEDEDGTIETVDVSSSDISDFGLAAVLSRAILALKQKKSRLKQQFKALKKKL